MNTSISKARQNLFALADSAAKGEKVELTGALRYSEWEFRPSPKAKPQKRSKHSVIVSEISAAA